jgi:hypothetical protein
MGKFSSIVLGAASGAVAAIFLSSEKGKEVRARVSNFIKEVQENPDEFKEQVCHSATGLKNQTVDTVTQVRDKVNNGEITKESVLTSVKETTKEMLDYSQDKFQALKEKIQEEHLTKDDLVSSIKEKAHALTDEKDHSEEIVIDLKED